MEKKTINNNQSKNGNSPFKAFSSKANSKCRLYRTVTDDVDFVVKDVVTRTGSTFTFYETVVFVMGLLKKPQTYNNYKECHYDTKNDLADK